MAVSLAFGVVFATVITLILVPAIYFILEDFIALFREKDSQEPAGKEELKLS
ncbi:MAG: hypothetical protein GY863_16175, partial [bacterium]|nr:hypothetical protein [bacterium]